MEKQPVVAIIGAGVMGEAIISGLLNKNVTVPGQIRASDPLPERQLELQATYGIIPAVDNPAAVHNAEVVILSVKPQRLDRVLSSLRN